MKIKDIYVKRETWKLLQNIREYIYKHWLKNDSFKKTNKKKLTKALTVKERIDNFHHTKQKVRLNLIKRKQKEIKNRKHRRYLQHI